jgi:hypothetical protein
MTILAYLLIITAVYTGSLTDGVAAKLTVETRAHSVVACEAQERSIVKRLRWLGASNIRATGCPKR